MVMRYVYDGNVVIQERDGSDTPHVSYTRGKDLSGGMQGAGGIGGLLAFTQYGTSYTNSYYHADGNGNVAMLISTNQAIVAKYLYDPFGNTLSMSGPLAEANLYRFSSKEWHANSGLVYYLYRFYEPNLQRWLNTDPIGMKGGINLYTFVLNDPVHLVDFFGHKSACAKARDKGLVPPGTAAGGVVCDANGKKHFCIWTDPGTDPGIDYCVGQHEKAHENDVDCPGKCADVSRPPFKPGVDPDAAECAPSNIEIDCLSKQKHASCGKLSGTARAQCYQTFADRIQLMEDYKKQHHCK